jgi:hypothetical protein
MSCRKPAPNDGARQLEDFMDIDTGTTELLCSVRDGVALITLNRP